MLLFDDRRHCRRFFTCRFVSWINGKKFFAITERDQTTIMSEKQMASGRMTKLRCCKWTILVQVIVVRSEGVTQLVSVPFFDPSQMSNFFLIFGKVFNGATLPLIPRPVKGSLKLPHTRHFRRPYPTPHRIVHRCFFVFLRANPTD